MQEFQPKGCFGILIRSPAAPTCRNRRRRPLTKRILVVDDQGAMGRLVKLHLEQDGHALILMANTNAALEAIDAGDTFDLYIIE
jgi:PleD family two-component response regulator